MLFRYSFFVNCVVSRTTSSNVLRGTDVTVLLRRDKVGLWNCFEGKVDGFDEMFTLKLRSLGGWWRERFKVLNVLLTEGTTMDFGYFWKRYIHTCYARVVRFVVRYFVSCV